MALCRPRLTDECKFPVKCEKCGVAAKAVGALALVGLALSVYLTKVGSPLFLVYTRQRLSACTFSLPSDSQEPGDASLFQLIKAAPSRISGKFSSSTAPATPAPVESPVPPAAAK